MIAVFIAALTLGFLGSFHCVGMCGPIALALPVHRLTGFKKTYSILLYNIGRGITYAVIGFMVGLLGKGFVITGYQQLLSIVLGTIILVMLLVPQKILARVKISSSFYSFLSGVKMKISKLFSRPGASSFFTVGILNGLLPCGLVYIGVAGAMATGDPLIGAFFMFSFGLGTMPAMAALSLLGSQISITARNKIRKTVPVMVGAMALLLILRGLNLGIPYISPKMSAVNNQEHKCCHK